METTDYSMGNSCNDVIPPVEGVAGGGTAYGWVDGDSSSSTLQTGVIDPLNLSTTDHIHVWYMPSTSNVGRQDMPRMLEPMSLLLARNERESIQVALRPKVSWGGHGIAGVVEIQCTDLCSVSGDRLVVGKSLTLRRVVPILGVPDALVPLGLPITRLELHPGETTSLWVSIDVPTGQSPGLYEGELIITAIKPDTESSVQLPSKTEKYEIYREIKGCLDIAESSVGQPLDQVEERISAVTTVLRRLIMLPTFSEFFPDNDSGDMIVDEDIQSCFPIHLKLSVTVWEFTLPMTPSLPAVIGISETVIEDRFGVEHGSDSWYTALDRHFKWLLQYRISPFFCRWGYSMRVLTYTCPWPADHPKADEYYSDPRLAAYAVSYAPVLSCNDAAKDALHREIEILKTKNHWKKAYFYLWDEPLNLEQYDSIRCMSNVIRALAPDSRILTTYYCGPNDAPLAPTPFEAFVQVPKFLRPHTQIFCTSEWVLGNREDLAKDIIAELQPENGEEWWTYVCMGPSDPHPNWHLGMRGTQHRAVMWRVWKEGGTGFLYWGANCYEKSTVPGAEIRFRRGLPAGDGVLFYPGEVFSDSNIPVASVRLERLLSGLQDIEYLNLYSSRYGREQAVSLLEKMGVYLGPERYTLEHMPIEVMRGEIFRTCRL